MAQLDFITAEVAVRPPRALLLVPCDDHWTIHVRQAMEWFSQTWGGRGHALLPVITGRVPSNFRSLVRAFDPDWLCVWQSSIRNEHDADPAARQTWLRTLAERMGVSVEEAETRAEADGTLDELALWPEGQRAAEEVMHWCAPHRMYGSSFVQPFAPAARTEKPLCDLGDLSRSTLSDQLVVRLDCDAWAPEELRLGVDARFGRFSPEATKRFTASGLQPCVLPGEPADLKRLAENLVIGQHITNWSLHKRWQAHHGLAATGEPPTVFSGEVLVNSCPMALTTTGLVEASSVGPTHAAVVIGDDPQAFFVALLLDRIFQSATWLRTSSIGTDYGRAVSEAAARGLARSHRAVGFRNLHIVDDFDGPGADHFASRVNAQNEHLRGPEAQVRAIWQLPLRATKFLVDTELQQRIPVPVEKRPNRGIDSATPLDTPKPSMASGRTADSLVWQVDVRYTGHDTAPRSLLTPADLTLDQGDLSDLRVRPGRHGLVFESHDMGFVLPGSGLPHMLARPRLRIPPVHEVFNKLHAQAGVHLQRSDAGDLTAGLLSMWSGLETSAADLRGPVRRILDGFSGERARINHGQGYLHYQLCRELVGDDEVTREVVDRLCIAGVLHRGFLLKCGRCGWRAFYRLGAVTTRSFECLRCGATTNLTESSWTGDSDPWWYYDLDQLIRTALEKNNDLLILTLDALRSMSRRSFSWMHETALYHADEEKPFAEIDLLALLDARVAVGEVKKADHLSKPGVAQAEQKEVSKYLKAANRIDADVLVFATAADDWSEPAMAAIEKAGGHGYEVFSLTNVGKEVRTRHIGQTEVRRGDGRRGL